MKNIILAGVLIAVLIIIGVMMSSDSRESLPAPTANENPLPVPVKSKVVWGNTSPGIYPRALAAKAQTSETVAIGGVGAVAIKITSSNPKLVVSMKNPLGETVKPDDPSVLSTTFKNSQTGETTTIYQIKNAGNQATANPNDWQISVSNQQTNATSTYNLTVSDPSLITSNPEVNGQESGNTGGTEANLTLTIQETIAIDVVVPVTGAEVIANITNPSGEESSVPLTEDPNNPGTYTGTFTDINAPGVYQVEYVISGEDAAGQPFDQIVTDEFTVTDPDGPTGNPSTPGTNKKFDINQSDEVRPIY